MSPPVAYAVSLPATPAPTPMPRRTDSSSSSSSSTPNSPPPGSTSSSVSQSPAASSAPSVMSSVRSSTPKLYSAMFASFRLKLRISEARPSIEGDDVVLQPSPLVRTAAPTGVLAAAVVVAAATALAAAAVLRPKTPEVAAAIAVGTELFTADAAVSVAVSWTCACGTAADAATCDGPQGKAPPVAATALRPEPPVLIPCSPTVSPSCVFAVA
ncbi:hypothetical protein Vretifemale_975 [Volvox reticuliferus]|uniref:Uncharacterized protein n=1 Tax=Volvox reticuliferus TaxID=1737510 RepID=A0A8J4FFT8_9CHLO|nr:hypothetical protein Vretifemale_975 [Volvox reticuliferus]